MLGGTISKSKKKNYKDGDLSAILLDEFPFWVNYHRVPDLETALMSEWEAKLDKIARQAVNENITNLTGVPSWMLILLKRILKFVTWLGYMEMNLLAQRVFYFSCIIY